MQPSCATAACGMHPQEWGPVEGGANTSEVKARRVDSGGEGRTVILTSKPPKKKKLKS